MNQRTEVSEFGNDGGCLPIQLSASSAARSWRRTLCSPRRFNAPGPACSSATRPGYITRFLISSSASCTDAPPCALLRQPSRRRRARRRMRRTPCARPRWSASAMPCSHREWAVVTYRASISPCSAVSPSSDGSDVRLLQIVMLILQRRQPVERRQRRQARAAVQVELLQRRQPVERRQRRQARAAVQVERLQRRQPVERQRRQARAAAARSSVCSATSPSSDGSDVRPEQPPRMRTSAAPSARRAAAATSGPRSRAGRASAAPSARRATAATSGPSSRAGRASAAPSARRAAAATSVRAAAQVELCSAVSPSSDGSDVRPEQPRVG